MPSREGFIKITQEDILAMEEECPEEDEHQAMLDEEEDKDTGYANSIYADSFEGMFGVPARDK